MSKNKTRKYDELCEELGIDPAAVAQQISAVAGKGMSGPDISQPPVQPHYSTGSDGSYGHPGPGSMDIKIEICGCSGNLTIQASDMKIELPSHITHALAAFFEQSEPEHAEAPVEAPVQQEQEPQGEEGGRRFGLPEEFVRRG